MGKRKESVPWVESSPRSIYYGSVFTIGELSEKEYFLLSSLFQIMHHLFSCVTPPNLYFFTFIPEV